MAKSKSKKHTKKKKDRPVYIDDGSTIVDMSGVGRKKRAPNPNGKPEPRTRAGSIWQTYWDSVRSMIGPMLMTIGIIFLAFLILWIILGFFG